jgi:hypothetical protein
MNCPVSDCPIKPDVEKVVRLSGDLAFAIHKLRRDLKKCRACPAEACQLRGLFNERVQGALTQITEEWNLGM